MAQKPKFRLFNNATGELFIPQTKSENGYRSWMVVDSQGQLMIISKHILLGNLSVVHIDTPATFQMSYFTGRTAPGEKSAAQELYTGDILSVEHADPYCPGKNIFYHTVVDIKNGVSGYYNETGRFLGFPVFQEVTWPIVGNVFNNESLLNEDQIKAWKESQK